MKVNVLIPVKLLANAKSRLSKQLSIEQREALVLSMVSHVIATLIHSKVCDDIYLVSKDKKVASLAKEFGVKTLFDKTTTHNKALTEASLLVESKPLLVISSDLPLVTTQNVQDMVTLLGKYDIVFASSKEQTGTNAIAMKKPLLLPYLFGRNSLKKFEKCAKNNNLSYYVYVNNTTAFDIDTMDDLALFSKSQNVHT